MYFIWNFFLGSQSTWYASWIMCICIFIIVFLLVCFTASNCWFFLSEKVNKWMKYKYMISNTCWIIEAYKTLLVGIFQSSLAAARADNFYYPPEWTPKQVHFLFNHISSINFRPRKFPCPNIDAQIFRFSLWIFLFQGSLNKFHGQHALRERARKLDQGILIIR